MANRGGRETFFDWITGWRRARTIRSLNAPRLSGSGVAEQKSERLYSDKPVNFCLYKSEDFFLDKKIAFSSYLLMNKI
jgi:hypothetical protein